MISYQVHQSPDDLEVPQKKLRRQKIIKKTTRDHHFILCADDYNLWLSTTCIRLYFNRRQKQPWLYQFTINVTRVMLSSPHVITIANYCGVTLIILHRFYRFINLYKYVHCTYTSAPAHRTIISIFPNRTNQLFFCAKQKKNKSRKL